MAAQGGGVADFVAAIIAKRRALTVCHARSRGQDGIFDRVVDLVLTCAVARPTASHDQPETLKIVLSDSGAGRGIQWSNGPNNTTPELRHGRDPLTEKYSKDDRSCREYCLVVRDRISMMTTGARGKTLISLEKISAVGHGRLPGFFNLVDSFSNLRLRIGTFGVVFLTGIL